MPPTPIRLAEKLDLVKEFWSPHIIAEMDDYQFKLAKLKGDFVWHAHEKADEMFLVLEGSLQIEFRDGSVALGPGDLIVVPRTVEHKPVAESECHVMLIERRGVVNTGDATESELTQKRAKWI